MSELIEVADAKCEPGAKAHGYLRIVETQDGASTGVPVIVVNGASPGPRLLIAAGIHGDEYEGIETIHRVTDNLDPGMLKGTVIAMPVVNMPAFRSSQRTSPIDHMNINRIFPGKPNGTITERIAHFVLGKVVKNAQYLIDLHSGGIELIMASLAIYHKSGGKTEKESEELAKHFGVPIIWQSTGEWLGGSLHTEAANRGIVAVAIEAGGEGRLREEFVTTQYRGVMNVMKHLGMIQGDPQLPKELTFISEANWIRTKRGGLLHPKVGLSQKVSKGDTLAVVMDLFGRQVEAIISPIDGLVVGIKTLPVANTGDWTYLIGRIVSE